MLESNCWHTRTHCLYFQLQKKYQFYVSEAKENHKATPRSLELQSCCDLGFAIGLADVHLSSTIEEAMTVLCGSRSRSPPQLRCTDLSVRPHTRRTRRTRRTRLTFASLASFMSFISFISFISSTFASRQSEQTPRSFRTSLGLGKFRDVQLRLCKSLTRSPWSRARDRFDRCNRKLRKPRKLQPRAQARAADFTELALWSTQHGPFCKAIFRSMRLIFSVHQDWNKLEQVGKIKSINKSYSLWPSGPLFGCDCAMFRHVELKRRSRGWRNSWTSHASICRNSATVCKSIT